MNVHDAIKSFNEAWDTLTAGRYTLGQICEMKAFKRKHWVILAGAVYPKGTAAERAAAAIREVEYNIKKKNTVDRGRLVK